MKNMKNTYSLFVALMSCAFITGCVEENLDIKLPVPKGDEVVFGARAGFEYADTKTIYNGNGALGYYTNDEGKTFESISWNYAKDRIHVYCPQSPIEYSHYKVMQGEGYSYLERTGDASIQWKNDTDGHDFYAMYPSTEMFEGEGGVNATLKQGVSMDKTAITGHVPVMQNPLEIKLSDDKKTYIAVPNMDYAYMVAKSTGVTKYKQNANGTREAQSVSLTFVPIVTAVQIQLSMDASSLVKPVSIGEIYIDGTGIAGDFIADLDEWTGTYPQCRPMGAGSDRISISTWQGSENNRVPLTLKPGESLILTVFLNPGAGKVGNLKVTISETGAAGVGKTLTGLTINPHIKTVIKDLMLPKNGISIENSKWLELMPDNVSLKALSIPGTGNSFSSAASAGFQSQKLGFADQWKLGIRAFEITTDRPADENKTFADEYVKCNRESLNIQVSTVFNDIRTLLSQNQQEFALVILNYQSEGSNPGRNVAEYAKAVAEFYDEFTKQYQKDTGIPNAEIFKLYSPNITLDDVRGKIMLVMRTNQEDEDSKSAFEGVKDAIGDRNIIAVDGCGSAKDKWRRRGYRIGESIENSLPALNIWDTDGNDAISEGKLIEDYMVGTSGSRNGTVTWKNNNWNDIIFPEEDYAGDFSYNCTTGESDETFKVWFQEWVRVAPEPSNNQDYTTYFINQCRYNYVIGSETIYYFTRWNGSYNEKLNHAKKAFQTSISGGIIGNESTPHVFINSLCGYLIDEAYKESCTPWIGSPDKHSDFDHSLGGKLNWPEGGFSGNISALATKLNNDFYNYVLNSGYEQATGPAGVIMMDMVSKDPADGGSYYLPGVIIGNNFKFTLDIPQYPGASGEVEDWESVELN